MTGNPTTVAVGAPPSTEVGVAGRSEALTEAKEWAA